MNCRERLRHERVLEVYCWGSVEQLSLLSEYANTYQIDISRVADPLGAEMVAKDLPTQGYS